LLFEIQIGSWREGISALIQPAFAEASAGQPTLLRYDKVGLACPAEAAKQRRLVPLAGIEPALLAELDFESSASTSSATGAFVKRRPTAAGAFEAGGI
jgi:hypothetical protein